MRVPPGAGVPWPLEGATCLVGDGGDDRLNEGSWVDDRMNERNCHGRSSIPDRPGSTTEPAKNGEQFSFLQRIDSCFILGILSC